MHEVLKWAGVVAAIWFAAALMVAIVWHRAKKAHPRIVRRDGTPISQRESDAVRKIMELDRDLRGGA